MAFSAYALLVPTTTLSGFIKSSTAKPSLRNSGLLTISIVNPGAYCWHTARTLSDVATGTVLLFTNILGSVILFDLIKTEISLAASRT